ncbi:hypothetical protein WMY93_020279 [Mugilogobius chulae]|uniref:Pentraxin (PTX) domain-containing protein n=1 Tax=Mugilogobius chulae TaxID=88201 RepID=A0AAW0NTE8_9GOBI
MKLLLSCVVIVSALMPLVSCEGESYWSTRYPYTTVLWVTFLTPYYKSATERQATRPESTTVDLTTTPSWSPDWTTTPSWSPDWTTRYYPTSPPPRTKSVSVCLRFMADSNSFNLLKLAPGSPLTLSYNNPTWFTLSWNYYSQVSLNPRVLLWTSIRTQPWTSVCMVLDSRKNVVQLFEGGYMSVRKIPPSRMLWSGEPVVDVSGFDGQVTDLEVWDYPLKYGQVFSYMQNYGSSGTVLSWSNIAYRYRGNVLFEETYALRLRQSISSSDKQEEPISNRLKFRKKFNGKKHRRRQML